MSTTYYDVAMTISVSGAAPLQRSLMAKHMKNIRTRVTGFRIAGNPDEYFVISQTDYVDELQLMPTNRKFSPSRSSRMRLAWLSHTRPDLLFKVSQLSQVTVEQFR